LEESACFVVKNIGKPCAGKPHARFDEGGQGETCSLLYPELSLKLTYKKWGYEQVPQKTLQGMDFQIGVR
jgi:hypothetical protein